jgi:hypothetical protein
MTHRPSIVRAVESSLQDCQPQDRDGAAVALVMRYAILIDDAFVLAFELTAAHNKAVAAGSDATASNLARLRARVDEIQVIDQLGPKLLAALGALTMTPASRAAGGKTSGTTARTPAAVALGKLRAVRD